LPPISDGPTFGVAVAGVFLAATAAYGGRGSRGGPLRKKKVENGSENSISHVKKDGLELETF
jgi:hypothetical protein